MKDVEQELKVFIRQMLVNIEIKLSNKYYDNTTVLTNNKIERKLTEIYRQTYKMAWR